MPRIKTFMNAKSNEQGVILLMGDGDDRIELLGSTIPTSLDGKQKGKETSFSLSVPKGSNGLIAVIGSGPNAKIRICGFFLEVVWDKEASLPNINLENQWVPTDPTRMPQIVGEHIEVLVDRQIFSSELRFKDNKKHRYVSGDVICRFVMGEISVEELELSATALVEQESLKAKVKRSEEELKNLQAQKVLLLKQRDAVDEAVKTIRSAAETSKNDLTLARERIRKVQKLSETIRRGWPWISRKKAADLIDITLDADHAMLRK